MDKKPVSRQATWARAKREHIMQILGPYCRECGATTSLTFDCIKPMGGVHHRLSSVARMTFYSKQFAEGNLQVLCAGCNSAKGANANVRYRPTVSAVSELREEWTQFQIRKQNRRIHTGTAPVVSSLRATEL